MIATLLFGWERARRSFFSSEIIIEGQGSTIKRDPAASDAFRLIAVNGDGKLTLEETTLSGGKAQFLRLGGGILNQGTVELFNSTLSGNLAYSGGGGVINDTDSSGPSAVLTLTNSTVSGNSVGFYGGGVLNSFLDGSSSTMTITNSTLSGNSAGFSGGGVGNSAIDSATSTVTITNSTLSGNSADRGAGVGNGAVASRVSTVTLSRSLVSGNTDNGYGAEVLNTGGGTVTANNSNLFGHNGLTNALAFYGFTPSGSDLTATSDGTTPTALAAILLPILADNGGPTPTQRLVTDSPAIDASPDDAACQSTDQRGVRRPQPPGGACDIGAFEVTDFDSDGLSDDADNCPAVPNLNNQLDTNDDGLGDVCTFDWAQDEGERGQECGYRPPPSRPLPRGAWHTTVWAAGERERLCPPLVGGS